MQISHPIVCLGNRGDSILRPLAVSELISDEIHEISAIIFSGGKTSGPSSISEAEQMANYYRSLAKSRNLPYHDIILEEESCDTGENAQNVRRILGETCTSVILVTSDLKLSRATDEFERLGFDVIGFGAETLLKKSRVLKPNEIAKLQRSEEGFHEYLLEPIARIGMRIEFVRKIVNIFTQKRLK